MIQNRITGIIFFEILFWFGAYNIFIFAHTFEWTLSEFFYFLDLIAESLKANKN